MIEIENVSKIYRSKNRTIRALDGVSLKLAPREFVAAQGQSGCGKTTLLLVMGMLLKPDQGGISILGKNVGNYTPDQRAAFRSEHVGFVFQQFYLLPYLTVLENVLTPSLVHPSGDLKERALELLERFRLSDRIHHVPGNLSAGEQQRTAMARALLNKPDILLADEPTGNLDEENASIVLNSLRDFAESGGTALLVTHDSSAAGKADRMIPMKNGRLL
ncbi:ABC transporter ATP-binding protein [Candidatus Sumerlaeota bacterium]|nr:ABC transporter ATP-binding protein [Candidatus Sumerlaeota bacterium]